MSPQLQFNTGSMREKPPYSNLLNLTEFKFWEGKCTEEVLSRLVDLETASESEDMKSLWNSRLPQVTHETIPCTLTEILGWATKVLGTKISTVTIKEGEQLKKEKEEKYFTAGKAIHQVTLPPDMLYNVDPCVISNIMIPEVDAKWPLPSWGATHSPQQYHPKGGISANLSPAGTFTDIHGGKNRYKSV
jgi:hypothetical protein